MEPTTEQAPRTRTSATPVGRAVISADACLPSSLREGDEIVVQHLDSPVGPLVRLAYRRADRVLRGPVTMTPDEVEQLLVTATTPSNTSLP